MLSSQTKAATQLQACVILLQATQEWHDLRVHQYLNHSLFELDAREKPVYLPLIGRLEVFKHSITQPYDRIAEPCPVELPATGLFYIRDVKGIIHLIGLNQRDDVKENVHLFLGVTERKCSEVIVHLDYLIVFLLFHGKTVNRIKTSAKNNKIIQQNK